MLVGESNLVTSSGSEEQTQPDQHQQAWVQKGWHQQPSECSLPPELSHANTTLSRESKSRTDGS